MRSTIKDVARIAGVSVATVSSVVNEKTGVREKLAEKVRRAITILNYHPDHIARSMRVRRTDILGIVVPQVNTLFFGQLLRGAGDEAAREGYSVLICDSNSEPPQEQRHLTTLCARRVDGILLAPTEGYLRAPDWAQNDTPVVLIDRIPSGCRGPAVTAANTEAAQEATNHLISLGHLKIAMITGSPSISTAVERLEGFRQAMGAAGIPIRDEYLLCGNFKMEEGYMCAKELLDLPVPPTAIISANEEITRGLIRAISESGVRCPEQVSVIGFDDFVTGPKGFSLATLFVPKLTTVAQPSYEIGQVAVQRLLRNIRHVENKEKEEDGIVRLKAELCIRESTAPPLR